MTRVNHRKSKHFAVVAWHPPLTPGHKIYWKTVHFLCSNALFQCNIGRGFVHLCTCAQTAGLIRFVILSDYPCEPANPSFLSIFRKGTWRATITLPCSGLNIRLLYLNSEMLGPFGFACVTLNPVFRRVTCFDRNCANLGAKCKYATKDLVPIRTRPFCFMNWPAIEIWLSADWSFVREWRASVTDANLAIPCQKFVPLISSVHTWLNLWLTHLSISFAKYDLVQIGS